MTPKVSTEYMRARRSEILVAATTVFSEKGFHAATLDDIATEAEISKGSIYVHFDSKEAMIDGLSQLWQTTDDEVFDAAEKEPRAIDGLAYVAKGIIRRMQRKDFNDSVRLGLFIWAEVLINPAVQKSQAKLAGEWLRRMHGLAVRAQEAGDIGPRYDPAAVVLFLGSVGQGLLIGVAWNYKSDQSNLERLVDSFLAGLRP